MFVNSDGMDSMLKELAIMAGNYKRELMKNGFTEDEAVQIVINWQQNLMQMGE